MQSRTLLIGILAVVFGISAAVGVYVMSQTPADARKPEMVTVLVAAMDLNRGQSITAEQVKRQDWPKDSFPKGAITSLDQAEDRTVSIPMLAGDVVLEDKLAPRGAGRGLAAIIPHGMRAVTIQTPNVATGVAGFILPGNKVDVLLTVMQSGNTNDASGGSSTITLLQNVEILAVDQRIEAPHDNKMDAKELRSVTLLVSPADAANLGLGQNRGMLHLALRNPEDRDVDEVEPATLNALRISSPPPILVVPQAAPAIPTDAPKPKKHPAAVIRVLRGNSSSLLKMHHPDDEQEESKPPPVPPKSKPGTPTAVWQQQTGPLPATHWG